MYTTVSKSRSDCVYLNIYIYIHIYIYIYVSTNTNTDTNTNTNTNATTLMKHDLKFQFLNGGQLLLNQSICRN